MSVKFLTPRRAIGLVLLLFLPPMIWFVPTPEGLSPAGQKTFALTVLAIILWVSELIRPEMTGILLMALFSAFGVAPIEKSFGGFLTSSIWLAFAGFVIGAGVLHSGLGRRLAMGITRLFGAGYVSSVIGLSLLGFLLAFAMPTAVARVTIMVPIAMTLGRVLGYTPCSKGMAGLTLASVFSTSYATLSILTAGIPSITLLGLVESLLGRRIFWSEWLVRMLPTFGVATLFSVNIAALLLFKEKPHLSSSAQASGENQPTGSMTGMEKKMLFYLTASLILWATDILHGVNAAWLGLLIAICMTLPRVGVLKFEELSSRVNFLTLFYVAGAISLAKVMEFSGFSEWATRFILERIDIVHLDPFSRAYAVVLLTATAQAASSGFAAVAMVTPVLISVASKGGLDPLNLLFIQMPAVNVAFFPYEVIPATVAYGYGAFTAGQLTKMMTVLAMLTLVLVIPLTVLYWISLGLW